MKRIAICLIFLTALFTSAMAQSDIYKKCEKEKSVTTVYVTKPMLQMMASNSSQMDASAMTMLRDKIDNVLIINADNSAGISFLTALREEFSKNKKAELLMQINDAGSQMRLYSIPLSKQNNQYFLSVLAGKHATTIVIEGTLTLDEISRITKGLDSSPKKK